MSNGRWVGVILMTSIVRPLFTQAVGLNIISPVLHLNRWMPGTLVREAESNDYYLKHYLSVESWPDGVR